MTEHINLVVNDQPVELDHFVEGFIDHTIDGMLASLKGTEEVSSLEILIEGDGININVNNNPLATNPFVSKIMINTIVGMVSSLKGVSEISKVSITVRR